MMATAVATRPFIIRRLDIGGSGKRTLYSYVVQNGRARDLARSLQLVLGDGGGSGGGDSFEPFDTGAASAPSLIDEGELPEPSEAIGPQTPLPGASTPVVAGGGGGPRVVPNDHNNSLLIYADGEEYEFIRDAQLRPRLQPLPISAWKSGAG